MHSNLTALTMALISVHSPSTGGNLDILRIIILHICPIHHGIDLLLIQHVVLLDA
jgi:hypothetical protein